MDLQKLSKKQLLDVSVRNRSKVLFEGKAFSVTSYNEIGEFDILPQHANFVTLIKDKVIVNKGLEEQVEIELDSGLMSSTQNRVDVYVGIQETAVST